MASAPSRSVSDTRDQVGPVVITDNGLTSFVPPCFHWELRLLKGERLVTTVSEIDVSRLSGITIERLVTEKIPVYGLLSRYDTPSGGVGVVLTVDSIHGPSRQEP